ncbi:MAG TPA: RNA polymerase sigma factor [Anaerolineae bacterium]|nr:RNA polymerase sigma factor [Anaerolineae bacterium]HPL27352.1 RNA polymerase sigma factor [Anaerolineae bacterium]
MLTASYRSQALESARCSPVDGLALIFEQYHAGIYRYLCRLVSDADLAEDLAQQTFLKAHQALAAGRPPDNMHAWLYTIATNTAFSALRRRRLIAWLPLIDEAARRASTLGPEARLGERELVAQALAQLPRRDAACLLLHFHEGLSCAEVAQVLGLSLAACKSRLYRARSAFCEAYLRLGGEVGQ